MVILVTVIFWLLMWSWDQLIVAMVIFNLCFLFVHIGCHQGNLKMRCRRGIEVVGTALVCYLYGQASKIGRR